MGDEGLYEHADKNLVSNRDTSKIGKILVIKFPNDFGIKN